MCAATSPARERRVGRSRRALTRRQALAPNRLDQIALVANGRREVGVANAERILIMGIAGAESRQTAFALHPSRIATADGIHVVRHQLQPVEAWPVVAEDVIEWLAPAERMR